MGSRRLSPTKLIVVLPLLLFGCSLGFIEIKPKEGLPNEIPGETEIVSVQTNQVIQVEQPTATPVPPTETATPTPTETPTPTMTPTPAAFLSILSTGPRVVIDQNGTRNEVTDGGGLNPNTDRLPRHGLIIAFVLPMLFCGIPWIFLEIFIIRYVQPRGIDLTRVKIRAKDGLFVEATLSMTARRTLTLASTRMTWPRVSNFVEKSIEQDLIQEAVSYDTLEDLEQNINTITDKLNNSDVIKELSHDFGVEVLRFNIEIQYTPETMEALQRKAEATAGGNAYQAYAAAARLNPDSPESRELYRVYQETSSQVDAARNLGGGIAGLAHLLGQRLRDNNKDFPEDEDEPNK